MVKYPCEECQRQNKCSSWDQCTRWKNWVNWSWKKIQAAGGILGLEEQRPHETVRILHYFLDGGMYCRGYIQEIPWDVFEQLNRPGMPLGLLVSEDDPLGSEYPQAIHPDDLTLWHGQLIWERNEQW